METPIPTSTSGQPGELRAFGGGGGGPASAPAAKAGVGFTSRQAYRFEGSAVCSGAAARLFEVDVEVTTDTVLSYVLLPDFAPGDLRYLATFTAVDLEFGDGTRLSDLGVRDQHGVVLGPREQGEARTLSVDQWNYRYARIGDVAAGRTVRAVLVGYDAPVGPGSVSGWVDAIGLDERPRTPPPARPSDQVVTTRGTHSSAEFSRGNTIPATAVPHGFNFWTPVTDAGSLTWVYEYHRANNADNRPELQAFALSHQTSPWMGDRQTFQVMPSSAEGEPDGDRSARALAFGHDAEIARPHYYAVTFDNGIRTEIAPADHAAMFRFTFPGDTSTLLFDNVNADAGVMVHPGRNVVTGFTDVRSRLSNGATRMFVVASFDHPVVASGRPTGTGERRDASGYVRFDTSTDKTVTMRIATSLISLEQAERNLALELGPDETFEGVRERAQRQWDEKLAVIEVEGASEDQLVTLYSNLYRLFLYPNSAYENIGTAAEPVYAHAVQSSVTTPPSTPTSTGARVVPGKVHVNNGFWDTYRTTWPAYALLTPSLAGELVDGFLQQYRDGGWISRWSSPGYADLMVGTSSDVAFADAFVKGVTGFDVETAYDAALKNATVRPPNDHVGRKGIDSSRFLGYTADESTHEAMSWAMDGYINDFGIAMMAGKLAERCEGDDPRRDRYLAEQAYFSRRARGYVHLFDPAVGFFQGRLADGRRRLSPEEFDPRIWGFDYTETNAWNMAFHAPHDGEGLANLYGGREKLAAKLDEFFATPETGAEEVKGWYSQVIHEMTEARDVRMGMYGHSNQPAHHIAYMYLNACQPWKTQEKVRDVLARLYLGSEIGQGYPGDEDNGEMSAWQVFSALGLYPLQVGRPAYAVGSPLFTRATIHLENGRRLVVSAPGNGPETPYVQSLTVNGEAYDATTLPHDLLAEGAVLEFVMGSRPSTWGTDPRSAPPSLTATGALPQPLVDITTAGEVTAGPGIVAARLFDDTASVDVGFDRPDAWVQCEVDSATQVELYTLTSASVGRDPSAWVVKGSRDGVGWDVLDTRTDEEFRWRSQTRVFALARPAACTHYRFEFTGGDGKPFALAQIELLAEPAASGSNTRIEA
ncbi:GH92 family glycosyl hydrolase [Actinopolymorpha sp. B17G11]|uniref:GH92 family glycosyl hydrolase n=1 Tax=Actinopolymorpha sp. B17G11 TaxID=3160861 RepID=UPI0032E45F1F